ncbi:MAG: hypothetical protein QM715_18665 [Nibricoccus sp.]
MKPAIFILIVSCLAGCVFEAQTASRVDRNGKPKVTQNGPAENPGRASVEKTVVTVPIPAGSKISQTPAPSVPAATGKPDMAAGITIQTSAPTEMRIETTRESVEGATTPKPSPPPSPVEVARGKGVRLFYWIAGGFAIASVVSAVRKYLWAAVCFGAAALVTVLGVNVVSEEWVIRAAGVLAVAGVVFVAAWKIIAARHGLAGNQAGTVAK